MQIVLHNGCKTVVVVVVVVAAAAAAAAVVHCISASSYKVLA